MTQVSTDPRSATSACLSPQTQLPASDPPQSMARHGQASATTRRLNASAAFGGLGESGELAQAAGPASRLRLVGLP